MWGYTVTEKIVEERECKTQERREFREEYRRNKEECVDSSSGRC
jgi:hypothetical protein